MRWFTINFFLQTKNASANSDSFSGGKPLSTYTSKATSRIGPFLGTPRWGDFCYHWYQPHIMGGFVQAVNSKLVFPLKSENTGNRDDVTSFFLSREAKKIIMPLKLVLKSWLPWMRKWLGVMLDSKINWISSNTLRILNCMFLICDTAIRWTTML